MRVRWTVAVIDSSPPTDLPELNIDDVALSEDGGNAGFRVSLSKRSDATVTVA